MKNITLAIDTSYSNGSLSLWRNDSEIGSCLLEDSKYHSKDLLHFINKLIINNELKLNDINRIIFTNGPGSFTGIRVGISTVLGLSRALNCKIFGISTFAALSMLVEDKDFFIIGILSGNNQVVYTESDNGKVGGICDLSITTAKQEDFEEYLIKNSSKYTLLSHGLFQRLDSKIKIQSKNTNRTSASDNVSRLAYLFISKYNNAEFNTEFVINYGIEHHKSI